MPVRIYDISKKLGLENKEVLSKAKVLGIAAAQVASSSLDKITAEYLEEQLRKDHPELATAAPPVAPPPPPANEPVVVLSAPEPKPVELEVASVAVALDAAPSPAAATSVEVSNEAAPAAPAESPVIPEAPKPPPPPAGPRLGEKIGFI